MKITFIGSGGWQGSPTPFNNKQSIKNLGLNSKDFRFRTSLHIETNKGKTILLEATPDIRLQAWKYNLKKPDVLLISHWHFDHFFGLLDLHWYTENNEFTIYGNSTTIKWGENIMGHMNLKFKEIKSFESIQIDNLLITPVPVNHVDETHGFILENINTGKKFVYLSDFFALPKNTTNAIIDAENITIDSTYSEATIDGDSTHLNNKDFYLFLNSFPKSQLILTNLGSYKGLTYLDYKKKYPKQIIAFDGIEIII